MDCRKLTLIAVAALLCFSTCCLAQEYQQQYDKFKDVPGIRKDDEGTRFIEVVDGEITTKYFVLKDDASKLIYFVNAQTNEPQWHDPRGDAPIPVSEEPETLDLKLPLEPPKPKSSSITVAVIAMLPVLLFAGGTAARVAYLQMYYPELLWPTKERRDRRKAAGGKFKPQKQRGKMNQDGKGGRSANS